MITLLLASSILVLSGSPPAAVGGTSYANTGGTGDRQAGIVATGLFFLDPGGGGGDPERMIDGDTTTNIIWFAAGDVNPNAVWPPDASTNLVKFDFGSAKVIDEVKFYQQDSTTHGVWQWQGSNDDSAWTDVGTNFTLGGSATQTITALSGNTTAYRYWRMAGVSGSKSSGPYIFEMEFKIQ